MKYEDNRYMTSKQLAIIAMTKALTDAKIPHYIDENGHAIVLWWNYETPEMAEDAPKMLDMHELM